MANGFKTNDLHPAKDWLKEKRRISDTPSEKEIAQGILWIKRHLKEVQVVNLKKGLAFVSRSATDKAFAIYEKKIPVVVKNKERAALKLNAKNNALKAYISVYQLETKEQREIFFRSGDGKNAFAFFEWNGLCKKPHLLFDGELLEEVEPSEKLRELLKGMDTDKLLADPVKVAIFPNFFPDPPPQEEQLPIPRKVEERQRTAAAQANLDSVKKTIRELESKRGRKSERDKQALKSATMTQEELEKFIKEANNQGPNKGEGEESE